MKVQEYQEKSKIIMKNIPCPAPRWPETIENIPKNSAMPLSHICIHKTPSWFHLKWSQTKQTFPIDLCKNEKYSRKIGEDVEKSNKNREIRKVYVDCP